METRKSEPNHIGAVRGSVCPGFASVLHWQCHLMNFVLQSRTALIGMCVCKSLLSGDQNGVEID